RLASYAACYLYPYTTLFRSPKKIPERSKEASRTGRGTSMGGAASAKERAAAGLNPVAGLDISLEDAAGLNPSGATATVQALSDRSEEHTSELQSRENLVCRL